MSSDHVPASAARGPWTTLLQYGAFAATMFGLKLWVIASYGNATPFWDQWGAEALRLYNPLVQGTLDWRVLFDPWNEHRILTSRLLFLTLFTVNGIWNPLLEMVAGAIVHIAALVLGIALLTRVLGKRHLPALLAFSVILFGIPFGWENTLWGFQSQFYFVLLFSIAGLWLTVQEVPLSARWWGGVACGVLSFYSLAPGIFLFPAAALMGVVFYATGLRRSRGQAAAIAILAAAFAVGVFVTRSPAYMENIRATSLPQMLEAFTGVLAWPLPSNVLAALVRNLPAVILAGVLLWKRPPARDGRWFLMALAVWSLGQAVGVVYGRAVWNLISRYTDFYTVAILLNFACLIWLANGDLGSWPRWATAGAGVWTLVVLVSAMLYGEQNLPLALATKRAESLAQEANTRCYVTTGDIDCLRGRPSGSVPYPDPERLALTLSLPAVRSILPSNIRAPIAETSIDSQPARSFVSDGYAPNTPRRGGVTIGSYGAQGTGAKGQARIQYGTDTQNALVAIPVAGYPLRTGMKLSVEQNGQRLPVVIQGNPGESWGMAYVSIGKGPFVIRLADSSTTDWLAVGAPIVVGRLDGAVDYLLRHYFAFLILGVVTLVLSITLDGFSSRTTTAAGA